MDIIVCIKRVPDLAEAGLEIAADGRGLRTEDLDFDINEWDDYAVEAAVRLKEQHGGVVTAITVGDEDAEEVLRRALAMGADQAILLDDAAFAGADPFAIATALHACIRSLPFDVVLCGAVTSDGASGQVGGMLAALLDVPQVALATGLEVDGGRARVRHEVEGGLEREVEVALPCLITAQSGLNQPRYVSIRGIRKVADVAIAARSAGDLGLAATAVGEAGSRVRLEGLLLPPAGKRAEILEGSLDAAVATLVERLRERGGL
ncbi:MAG: electron transfer flavoprotein subunit beta/FixA family protein [Planctomycetes bacterium]|nr:electron transfer flavoprotein subunit beta/FixA family protein [Planctomycetota bacterium]